MYGIAIVIRKTESETDKIPYIFIGGFDTLNWSLAENDGDLETLNEKSYNYLDNEPNGITTLKKLRTAPVDNVLMLTGKTDSEYMETKPINGKGIDLKKYLNL